MRGWSRCLGGVVLVAGLLPATRAGAETAALELKRVDTSARPPSGDVPVEYLFRMTRPQTVFQQLGGGPGIVVGADQGEAPSFSDVVTKEPAEYAAETPFRGVVQLGSRSYGFVLDSAVPEEVEAEPPATDDEEGKKKGGLFSALGKALAAPLAQAPAGPSRPFTRLYFDRNGNGDLTDDGVIEAESAQAHATGSRTAFPVVELAIDVDGKKVDYAFTLSVRVNVTEHFAYAQASFNAAAYREGEILLDGKQRRVVLVDFNSNGRFDDAFAVDRDARGDAVQPVIGDMLYLDPRPTVGSRSPYDPTTSADQYQVGKLIAYGGRFFDLEIGGGGETVTLTPSTLPVGYAANPNHGARAIVYGEQGMLEISFDEQGKAMLPEGTWRLLSYTLVQPGADAVETDDGPAGPADRPSVVSARAGRLFKAARVADGKTTNLLFGPPYTPQVTASRSHRGEGTLSLQMSLIGAGGDVCSSMLVHGRRPPQPEFIISTKDGEEVASGKFSYG